MEAYVAVAARTAPTPGIAKKHTSRSRQYNRYDQSRIPVFRVMRDF
jgi:hypothetical protein